MSPLRQLNNTLEIETLQSLILTAISDLGQGLFVIDGTRIIFANEACERISGYGTAELMAMPSIFSLATEEQLPVLMKRLKSRMKGEDPPSHYQTAFKHKDGHTVHIEVAVKVLRKSLKPQLLVLARDVTQEIAITAEREQFIASHKQWGDQVAQDRNRLLSLFQQAPALVFVFRGREHTFDLVNPLARKLLGDRDLVGMTMEQAFPELHGQQIMQVVKGVYESAQPFYGNEFAVNLDWDNTGEITTRYFNFVCQPYYDQSGNIDGVMAFAFEVTNQVQSRKELEESQRQLQQVQERLLLAQRAANIGSFEWEFATNKIFWTPELERIYNLEPGEFAGTREHWRSFTHPEDIAALTDANELAFKETGELNVDFRIILKDTSVRWVSCRAEILKDAQGKQERMVGVIMDITEKKKIEELMTYQALHDPLTGLPNRKALDEQFLIARNNATRTSHTVAIVFLDLDRFKSINDTLGHTVGDMILKEVAARFKGVVRPSDTVARLGGDEFIIVLNDLKSSRDAVRVAQKLLRALNEPFTIEDNNLHVSTSLGIALYPQDGENLFTLLKHADIALYRAKEAGRNRFQFYDYAMNLQSHAKLSLENDLRYAISRNELELYYQPIVSGNLRIEGIETLIRWNHPRQGLLSPHQIIPLAEETGQIIAIGNWVMQMAMKQHAEWLAQGLLDCRMSINLSGRQFSEFNLMSKLQRMLEDSGIAPDYLELEITESIAMESTEQTRAKFEQLQRMNVSISIDDFGTGYSSLSYLKNFPVSRLKIDKSFVRHCTTSTEDAAIIRAILTMAKNLHVQVVAEGVERGDQFEFLKQEGVDSFQGYLFSKPVPAADLTKWLKKSRS